MKQRLEWVLAVALAGLCAAVYRPALGNGFVLYDDDLYVTNNAYVTHGLTEQGIEYAFTVPVAGNWHPLTMLSLMADAQVWGGGRRDAKGELDTKDARVARGFHLTNLVLHTANVLLLFFAVARMTRGSRRGTREAGEKDASGRGAKEYEMRRGWGVWPAFFVAGLLAAHPMHVESVAWVSERKDVLFLFFWLIATHCYVSYARDLMVKDYVLTAVAFACALMAKPMAVTLPMALLLLDIWPMGRLRGEAKEVAGGFAKRTLGMLVVEKIPMLAVAGIFSAVTVIAQQVAVQPEDGRVIDLGQRAVNAVVSYGRYAGKLVWPVDLAALYPYPSLIADATWPVWMIAASGLFLAVMSAVAVWVFVKRGDARWARWGFVFTGWWWFVGTMVPVIGLVQVGRQSMADRYAYVPFVGLYVLAVFAVAMMVRGRRAMGSAACVMGILVLGTLTVRANDQVKVWRDTETLFAHAVAVTDENWLMISNLGVLKRRTDLAEAKRLQREAIAIYPDSARMRAQLAGMLWQEANELEGAGRRAEGDALLREAVKELTTAVERNANDAMAHRDLGIGLFLMKRNEEALKELERAVELRPTSGDIHKQLAIVLAELGRMDEAMGQIKKAIEIDPGRESEYRGVLEALRGSRQMKSGE